MNEFVPNNEQELKKDVLEKIRSLINQSPEKMAQELIRSPETTWLSCFNTRLFIISLTLDSDKELGINEKNQIEKKLNELSKKVRMVDKKYFDNKITELPDEIKNELLNDLINLLD
ncbi:MAG: hypothetical protein ACD_58C00296G0010 [uncultured bacterium]|nr:MAG: hypothetical protein ACD_58C00296G0010 [uncultured bacterium]